MKLTVKDSETGQPVSGANVFFTDFIKKSEFDWKMETRSIGKTDGYGIILVPIPVNQSDSIRIEAFSYYSFRAVLMSRDKIILGYRDSDGNEVIERSIIPLNEFVEVFMVRSGVENEEEFNDQRSN